MVSKLIPVLFMATLCVVAYFLWKDVFPIAQLPVAHQRRPLVVVSALSSNHYEEAQDMIGSVQHFLPDTQLVIYDLGLSKMQRDDVIHLCNVEVRDFNFDKYPPHFRRLTTYAWKPAIVWEMAQEYDVVFWGDASTRMVSDFSSTFPKLDDFPVKAKHHNKHIVRFTHEGMLRYFNMTRKQMRGVRGVQACMLLIKWSHTTEKFLDEWLDCAKHLECIAPRGSRVAPCALKKLETNPWSLEYIGCHRYDQSALNLLLMRTFGREAFALAKDGAVEHFRDDRHPTKTFQVKKCLHPPYTQS